MSRASRSALTAFLAAATVAVALASGGASAAPSPTQVFFVDVGAGDAVVARVGGKVIVTDVGEFKIDNLYAALDELGTSRIDYLILTHPHDDHIKNARRLILDGRVTIRRVLRSRNTWWQEGATNSSVLAAIDGANIPVTLLEARDAPYRWGGATWHVLHPPQGEFTGGKRQAGTSSVVYLLETNGKRLLFTGDIEENVSAQIASEWDFGKVDLFLATHHGSQHGSTTPLLDKIKPAWAVISVGRGHGHPDEEAVVRLHRAGATIWCTAANGTVQATIPVKGRIRWRVDPQRLQTAWWLRNEQASRGPCVDLTIP